ncbi:hypothetical protein BH586_30940 [Pseudomonas aeruginosa]|nr:hypothetical protein BH586_30940 [Pseudomonas aeruginosa]OKR02370.1 hypothetical protein BH588_21945 [Pseudomonas aeruginosa]OWH92133.1 hypothetical protein CDC14_30115 [Pseudomonas aeruginosa]OWJ04781.1 hypothetical protein CDC08_19760 [Pseudomonas aeruginosa]
MLDFIGSRIFAVVAASCSWANDVQCGADLLEYSLTFPIPSFFCRSYFFCISWKVINELLLSL